MKSYTVGLSSCGKQLNEELFAQYAFAGIQAMEISPEPHASVRVDLRAIRALAERHGIVLWSYHLPFYPFERIDPSSLDAQVRKNTVECFSEIISQVSDAGIDKIVIHPSGEPIPENERSERLLRATEVLGVLGELAHQNGATLAVEDLPRTCLGNCSAELMQLLGGSEHLRVCFDTNHLLTESASHFLAAIGDKVITTHVSDYDFVNERHWLPGEGKQDWNALLAGLEATGYAGVWMYELQFEASNIQRTRPLCCADFVRNANELFAGKTPTII